MKGPSGALGSVDAVEHLPVLLRDLSARTATSIRISHAGGPFGRPSYVKLE